MSEIPEHLLKRAQEARERAQVSDEGAATATEEKSESTENSQWNSSPLVPEVDEIPF